MPNTPLISATPTGVISYNGLTFNNTVRAEIKAEPVYDRAGRVVTHVKYMLMVHGFLAASERSGQESQMHTMQDALTAPGATLTISTIGFDSASITTNAGGNRPEILWGTKPRLLSMNPAGGDLAWEFVWECEFNVSRTAAGEGLSSLPFMAFNYEWAVSIDSHGLTTRTIAGYAQVPAIRGESASRNVLFNVDSKWDQITVNIPRGFRRVVNTHKINDARNTIDFVMVDQELTGPAFPAGIVEIEADYDFENDVPSAFTVWTGTISATLTTAPGLPTSLAAEKFFILLNDKITFLRQMVVQSGAKHFVLPKKLRFNTQLFGRTSRFHVSFMVIGCLKDLLQQSGMWQPPNTDWDTWAQSMQGCGVFDRRGVAGLKFNTGDDGLIDPASQTQTVNIGNDSVQQNWNTGQFSTLFGCEGITPERSYMAYRNRVEGTSEQKVKIHRLMQAYTPPQQPSGEEGMELAQSTQEYKDHVTEYSSAPDNLIAMIGDATRIRYQPAVPKLTNVDGTDVEEVARKVDIRVISNMFGCPVWRGRWIILYRVKGKLSSVGSTSTPPGCFGEDKPAGTYISPGMSAGG